MTIVSKPNVTVNILPANEAVQNTPQKVLFIGRKSATSTAVSADLYRNIDTAKDAATLFGADSELAAMIDTARRVNPVTIFDALCFDQNASGSAAATNTITVSSVSGAASFAKDGDFYLIIGSRYLAEDVGFHIQYSANATPESIASQIATQLTADKPDNFPVTLTAATAKVTLTSVNVGSDGASTPVIVQNVSDPDLKLTVGSWTTSPETGLPANAFDKVVNDRYQTVISSSVATNQDLTGFLDPRFNINNKVLDGIAVRGKVDTSANLINVFSALNSLSLYVIADKLKATDAYHGGSYGEISYIIAAQVGAIRALRLTQDADIARFVTASAALDATGGPAIASLPYFNTLLPLLLPTKDLSSGFDDMEMENLAKAGVSVFGNNVANNAVILGEALTTYKTDNAGNPDISFKYVNCVDTSSNAREYMFNNARKDFAQSRLTSSGGLVRGRTMENAESIQGDFCGYYKTLSLPQYVLTQASQEEQAYFKKNLKVTVDMAQGKATVIGKLPIVTQLRSIIASLNLTFNF